MVKLPPGLTVGPPPKAAGGAPSTGRGQDQCIVAGCTNRRDRGGFVGDLCVPCHDMLSTGVVGFGTTFVHDLLGRESVANKIMAGYARVFALFYVELARVGGDPDALIKRWGNEQG